MSFVFVSLLTLKSTIFCVCVCLVFAYIFPSKCVLVYRWLFCSLEIKRNLTRISNISKTARHNQYFLVPFSAILKAFFTEFSCKYQIITETKKNFYFIQPFSLHCCLRLDIFHLSMLVRWLINKYKFIVSFKIPFIDDDFHVSIDE